MNEILTSLFSGGIWAIIKAVLILLLAFVTSAIVKSLVVKLFTKTKLNGSFIRQTMMQGVTLRKGPEVKRR